MKITNLLNRVIGNNGRPVKKLNEYVWWSPFVHHHKPKLQINVKTGKWHCWVSNQGGHNLFQLLKKLKASREHFEELSELVGSPKKSLSLSSNRGDVKQKILRLPDEYKPLWESDNSIVKKHALVHLKKRKIEMCDIIRYNIGYCESGLYGNRIIVPSYDDTGELNYFIARSIFDGGMKYKNPPVSKDVIGLDLFINWDEPIVLCEGIFDAIAIKRNAIPLLGKNIQSTLMKKIITSIVDKIYIALDSDAFKQSLRFCEKLMNEGKEIYLVDVGDKDASEHGFHDFTKIIQQTKPLTYSKLLEYKLSL